MPRSEGTRYCGPWLPNIPAKGLSWRRDVLVHHEVDDVDHWLAQTTREEVFGQLGITDIKTYSNPQNPTQVGLTMEVPDLDALIAMLETPEAAEAMKKDGVRADTVVLCVES